MDRPKKSLLLHLKHDCVWYYKTTVFGFYGVLKKGPFQGVKSRRFHGNRQHKCDRCRSWTPVLLFLYPPGHQREVPLFTLGFLPVKTEISLLVGVRPWVSVKPLEKMNWPELLIKGTCNCLERTLTLACWLLQWVPVPLVTLFRNKQSILDQPHLKISPPSWLRYPHSHMLHT